MKKERLDIEACVMRLLGMRDHSSGELRDKLRKRDFDRDLIDEVLAFLVDTGWVNDVAFAEHQAAILVDRGWGPLQIRKKLCKHGISRQLASSTVEALGADWVGRARAQVQRRFGDLDYDDHPRAFRHLEHRGFPASISRRALFD